MEHHSISVGTELHLNCSLPQDLKAAYKDRAIANGKVMFVGLLIGSTGFFKYESKVDYYVPMPIKINDSSSGRDGNAEGVL